MGAGSRTGSPDNLTSVTPPRPAIETLSLTALTINPSPSQSIIYRPGARVQEIADLRACDLQLTKPFQVRLFGKGRKERYCPLWPQTAAVLKAFSDQRTLDLRSESRVFLNHRGQPLTRFGIR